MNYSLILGNLTLLLGVAAALFFTSSIVKPLNKLKNLMKKAEGGDLDVYFESKYSDEIGQLGKSFNNMIEEFMKLFNMVYSERKWYYVKKKYKLNLNFFNILLHPALC